MRTIATAAAWLDRRSGASGIALGSVSLLGVAGTLDAGLSVVQGLAVARMLGPDGYGLAALVVAYAGILQGVLDPRSSDATVKFVSEASAAGDRARAAALCTLGWVVDVAIALLAFAAVAATAGWASARVLHAPDAAPLLVLYAAGFVPRALGGTATAVLQTLGRFRVLAAAQLGVGAVRTAIVVGLVAAGYGVRGVVFGLAAAMTVHGLWLGGVALSEARLRWHWRWDAAFWRPLRASGRDLGRFLALNNVNVLLGLVVKQLDTLVLGWWRGPTEAGFYRLARSIGGLVGLAVFPLQTTTYPELARAAAPERRAVARRAALRVGLPAGAVALAGALVAPHALVVLAGAGYGDAVVATQIVLAGAAVWLASFWLRPLVLAEGRLGRYTGDYLASLLPFALSYAVLAPRFGAAGMAIGYLGHNVLLFALAGLRVLR